MHGLLYPATSGYLCRSSGFYNISRKISLQLFTLAKMNAGGKSGVGHSGRELGSSPIVNPAKRELGSSPSVNSAKSYDPNHSSNGKGRSSYSASVAVASSKQPESCYVVKTKNTYDEDFPPLSATINSGSKVRRLNKNVTPIEQKSEDFSPLQIKSLPIQNYNMNLEDDISLPTSFGKKSIPSRGRRKEHFQSYPKYAVDIGNSESLYEEFSLPSGIKKKGTASRGRRKDIEPFDICHPQNRKFSRQKPSSVAQNRESMSGSDNSIEGIRQALRPGMVLLKNYITHNEQVKIVKKCRELGLSSGGFYQPSYRDGAKLRLQMMCLGLNWDPETRKYKKQRAFDGSEAPPIPHELSLLVERAIQDSHTLIKKDPIVGNVEDILPSMSPNICIVNFYTTSGRLGLHQDRDESTESLRKGLPVVSFSVGNSAEFLYGDRRDINKAENLLLESGDVLVFGGESRHIFHGVSTIIPNSAPVALLEETNISPGRLNLTFRQY